MLRELEPADRTARRRARSRRSGFRSCAAWRVIGRRRDGRRDRGLGRSSSRAGERCRDALVDARAAAGRRPAIPALLFFSSGSTGKPKGILNAHRGVSIQIWRWRAHLRASTSDVRTWSANGLFWSGNFAMALGGTLAAAAR